MSKARPNLFMRATSELSQDAFLCWLLDWADEAHAEADPGLHGVARDFIVALFRSAKVADPPEKFKVNAQLQVNHADIVAEVGDLHLLVIEDKVHAEVHGDQLERYRESFAADATGRTLVLVFLKTGDQASYDTVTGEGWARFSRADLLEILRRWQDSVSNSIFVDFLDHLEEIEQGVQRYRNNRPGEWQPRDPAYRGLYMEIGRWLGTGKWSFVNNPARGFYGFWWGDVAVDGGQVYLQIEEDELKVRVRVVNKEHQSAMRDFWIDLLCNVPTDVAEQLGFLNLCTAGLFRPPIRRGKGRTMAVAVLRDDYRKLDAKGFVDLAETVTLLKNLTRFVEALARSNNVSDYSRSFLAVSKGNSEGK